MSAEISQLSKQDRERLARGAQVSINVGPCEECGQTWAANPLADTAKCPFCTEQGAGADNSDTPTVDVPSWGERR